MRTFEDFFGKSVYKGPPLRGIPTVSDRFRLFPTISDRFRPFPTGRKRSDAVGIPHGGGPIYGLLWPNLHFCIKKSLKRRKIYIFGLFFDIFFHKNSSAAFFQSMKCILINKIKTKLISMICLSLSLWLSLKFRSS